MLADPHNGSACLLTPFSILQLSLYSADLEDFLAGVIIVEAAKEGKGRSPSKTVIRKTIKLPILLSSAILCALDSLCDLWVPPASLATLVCALSFSKILSFSQISE